MRDYIEREAAMAAACKALCHPGVLCPDFKCAEVRDAFNAIPAADVRPVVTCGECKYNRHCFTQSFVRDESVIPFDPNTWFCADGKRTDGEP